MFICFLLGGMGLGITVGLLDVLVLHLDAINSQNHSSGGLLPVCQWARWTPAGTGSQPSPAPGLTSARSVIPP